MQGAPEVGTRWRHKASKATYIVIDNDSMIEKTMEAAVTYMADASGTKWIRPLHEFMDGRFELVPGKPPFTVHEVERPTHPNLWID